MKLIIRCPFLSIFDVNTPLCDVAEAPIIKVRPASLSSVPKATSAAQRALHTACATMKLLDGG